jgi:hypothetical protein
MLAVGLAWAGNNDRLVAALVAAALGAGITVYYGRSVSRLASAFEGLKGAVGRA